MIHLIFFSKFGKYKYAYHVAMDEFDEDKISDIHEKFLSLSSPEVCTLYSQHVLSCEGKTFDDIRNMDPYFKDAKEIGTIPEFIQIINSHCRLTSIDVASFICKKRPDIGAFALQKVLYYIYAEYLKFNKYPLFTANFLAFDKGPVDWEVYRAKKYDDMDLIDNNSFELKITALEDRSEILSLVNKVIDEYADYYDDVWKDFHGEDPEYNWTHKEGTPWCRAYEKGQNSPILDSDIIKYHYLEVN